MSTLTVAELQAQVETDLSNATLQKIIDAVERDIEEAIGPATGYVKEYGDDSRFLSELRLPVKASSITTVVEYTDSRSKPTKTTLAADDYELSDDSWWLRRLSDGTNARSEWSWHVVVTFEPAADEDRREQAAVQLARLMIINTGYGSERVGDWTASNLDYRRERSRILSMLDETLIS